MTEGVKGGLLRRVPLPGCILASEVVEGASDGSKILNKTRIEISKTQKSTDSTKVTRDGPFTNGLDLSRIHRNFSLPDDKTQIFDFELLKDTLLGTEEEVVRLEAFEDFMGDLAVLFKSHGEDEDVVEVNAHHAIHDKVVEDVIHYFLEHHRAVG